MPPLEGTWSAVLILGATGEVGKAIADFYNAIGFRTIGSTRDKSAKLNTHYTITAPYFDEAGCESLKNQLDVILSEHRLHLHCVYLVAGLGVHDDKMNNSMYCEMWDVNVNMPEWWCENGPDVPYVLFSSGAVYGTQGTVPLTKYAYTKREAEKRCRKTGSHLFIVRLAQVRTQFLERAKIEAKYNPVIAISAETAARRIIIRVEKHLRAQESFRNSNNVHLILIGWATKFLHIMHAISPSMAQKFLQL